ncbi:MAG: hypothetical protein ACREI2_15560 [Nitrospiraceae bacterium]
MKPYLIMRGAIIVASLALITWLVAPVVRAADQPTGPGTPSQKEEIKKEEVKKDSTDVRSEVQREAPVSGELGEGTERPMIAPEAEGSANPQAFDPETREHMRKYNDIVSF